MKNQIKQIIPVQILAYFAVGLFAPAWYQILVQRSNGIANLGIVLGIVSFAAVASAYLFGRMTHHISPMKLMSISLLLFSLVLLAYIPDFGIYLIYLLQILYGMLSTGIMTIQQIIVARDSAGEGKVIGSFNSIMQIAMASAMVVSGLIASKIGGNYIVMISSFLLFIGSILSYQIVRNRTVEFN